MKNPKHSTQQADISYALQSTPWDLGNQVLYDMCSSNPRHVSHAEAVSKIWLIGRSYAAAIERRKDKTDESDDFYEEIVGPGICNSNIDEMLSSLPTCPADPVASVKETVRTHKKITVLFEALARMGKRSLASKYLHFHRPDIFFIYDSRAQTAIKKITPDRRYVKCVDVSADDRDELYYKFCMRACWLLEDIFNKHRKKLTPRQLDKVLLNVHRRIG